MTGIIAARGARGNRRLHRKKLDAPQRAQRTQRKRLRVGGKTVLWLVPEEENLGAAGDDRWQKWVRFAVGGRPPSDSPRRGEESGRCEWLSVPKMGSLLDAGCSKLDAGLNGWSAFSIAHGSGDSRDQGGAISAAGGAVVYLTRGRGWGCTLAQAGAPSGEGASDLSRDAPCPTSMRMDASRSRRLLERGRRRRGDVVALAVQGTAALTIGEDDPIQMEVDAALAVLPPVQTGVAGRLRRCEGPGLLIAQGDRARYLLFCASGRSGRRISPGSSVSPW
jgi:hypothetical protein